MNIATSTNILYERDTGDFLSMEDSIKACAAAGYKELDFGFVELNAGSLEFSSDSWKEEILHFKQLAGSLGVKFVQAHATIYEFCDPDTEHEKGLALFRRSIEGAAILGIPWIVAHPSTGVNNGEIDPETHNKNIAFFREQADYAMKLGVGIALENMWGKTKAGVLRYAVSPEELVSLIDGIGRNNVGACWDVEHASIEGINQEKAIRLLGSRLKATHISDETGSNNIHILPYTGLVNWEAVFKGLKAINYQGVFAFEIQHYLPHMPMELVPGAMKFSVEVGKYMIAQIIR